MIWMLKITMDAHSSACLIQQLLFTPLNKHTYTNILLTFHFKWVFYQNVSAISLPQIKWKQCKYIHVHMNTIQHFSDDIQQTFASYACCLTSIFSSIIRWLWRIWNRQSEFSIRPCTWLQHSAQKEVANLKYSIQMFLIKKIRVFKEWQIQKMRCICMGRQICILAYISSC